MSGSDLRRARFLVLAACLFAARLPAQKPSSTSEFTTNVADRAACERQLGIIHTAIQEYRRAHNQELPSKLSDLTPEFIHNANVLICPFVQKRGGLRTWKKNFRELSPDPFTSYSYEFSGALVDPGQWRGVPRKTWRQVKERLMERMGPVVPIVRCHDHERRVNLGFNGELYESGLYWEAKFTPDEHLLTVPRLFSVPAPALDPVTIPPRDPAASPKLLDLTRHYNARLADAWQGYSGNTLAAIKPGIHELQGVRFDVRGVIQAKGSDIPVEFPMEVTGIAVHQKCERIHFLHAASMNYKIGATNGFYRIHYANGQVRSFQLRHGHNIADWWALNAESDDLPEANVAWTGDNEAARVYGATVRLYHAHWANPLPEAEIATITLDAWPQKYLRGPFVVAITLE